MGFTFQLEVVGGEQAIRNVLMNAVSKFIDNLVDEAIPRIKPRVDSLLENAIRQSKEYAELTQGELWHELGLKNPVVAIDAVIQRIIQSISITKIPVTNAIGGLRLQALPADYSDILGIPEASFPSFPSRERVYWLKWLLTGRGQVLVSDYIYKAGTDKKSRTGSGIMVKRPGDTWSLDVAGTPTDNWLTRAFASVVDDITNIITEELNR